MTYHTVHHKFYRGAEINIEFFASLLRGFLKKNVADTERLKGAEVPKTRQQKEETVVQLKDKLSRAKSVVFADYRGLTMKQLSQLRSTLHDAKAEFTITKNTLLSRALLTSDIRLPISELDGPTAALFAYDDEISPIKLLVKSLKDAAVGKVKVGFLGGQLLDETQINQLALLPTKDELRGKTVGILVAPIQGMVGVFQANLRNLVYAISEIQKQKGGV